MTNLEQRYSHAQQDLERQGKLAEEEVWMIAVKLSATNLSLESKVNAIEGLLKVQQFWSRKCDESGEGFDDGWLMGDFIYLKYEKDVDAKLIDWAVNEGYKSWSLERVKEYYYENGSYYYTEWDFYDEVENETFYLELSTGDVVSWDEYIESHEEKIDLNENQPTLYLKEQPTEVRKWCRKCDVTGVGTDKGFVHYDSDFITITEEDTAKVLREDLRNGVYDALEEYLPEQFDTWSDNEVIEWCFENTSLYFNEWNLEEEIKFGGYYFIEYSDGSIKQA